MRLISLALFCSRATSQALAETIPAPQAGSHVGQSATVEGVVSEVHTARSGKASFIDIGGTYPNQAFTAVIFERNMAAVEDVSGLTGKTVDVTGTIQTYSGRPEIVAGSREQIATK